MSWLKWARVWQNEQNDVRPAKTQISLGIRWSSLSAWRTLGWVLNYPLSAQWSLWLVWADVHADLSLRWAHRLFCWFWHAAAQMLEVLYRSVSGDVSMHVNWGKAKPIKWVAPEKTDQPAYSAQSAKSSLVTQNFFQIVKGKTARMCMLFWVLIVLVSVL